MKTFALFRGFWLIGTFMVKSAFFCWKNAYKLMIFRNLPALFNGIVPKSYLKNYFFEFKIELANFIYPDSFN